MTCQKCHKNHRRFKNGKTRKMCKGSKGQKGGSKALAADITRGTVMGIRKGMEYVPGGNIIMAGVNPFLDQGLKSLFKWEKGLRPIDTMSAEQKQSASNAYDKKTKGKEPRRKKARMLLERLNRGSFRGRWHTNEEKIMKDGGYKKVKGGYKKLHMTSNW